VLEWQAQANGIRFDMLGDAAYLPRRQSAFDHFAVQYVGRHCRQEDAVNRRVADGEDSLKPIQVRARGFGIMFKGAAGMCEQLSRTMRHGSRNRGMRTRFGPRQCVQHRAAPPDDPRSGRAESRFVRRSGPVSNMTAIVPGLGPATISKGGIAAPAFEYSGVSARDPLGVQMAGGCSCVGLEPLCARASIQAGIIEMLGKDDAEAQ
jgi:hypothetical protein